MMALLIIWTISVKVFGKLRRLVPAAVRRFFAGHLELSSALTGKGWAINDLLGVFSKALEQFLGELEEVLDSDLALLQSLIQLGRRFANTFGKQCKSSGQTLPDLPTKLLGLHLTFGQNLTGRQQDTLQPFVVTAEGNVCCS